MSRPKVPTWLNAMMKSILRSPLHGMVSKSIMLISFSGRKSGKLYTTPIRYIEEEGYVLAFTAERWVQNLRGGAPVTLQLRGKSVQGVAQTISGDITLITAGLGRLLRVAPGDAKYLEIALDAQGQPNADDLRRAAQITTMIRVPLRAS
ncbi:MAG: nitroreductase/quinone reductase family protein [Anaerolineae bacterium]